MQEVSHAEINPTIWDAVSGSQVATLEEIAPNLTQPTLIIWCKQDRIFHVTGASVLDLVLPNSELIMPDGCGHLPMLDRPVETGTELRNFLADL